MCNKRHCYCVQCLHVGRKGQSLIEVCDLRGTKQMKLTILGIFCCLTFRSDELFVCVVHGADTLYFDLRFFYRCSSKLPASLLWNSLPYKPILIFQIYKVQWKISFPTLIHLWVDTWKPSRRSVPAMSKHRPRFQRRLAQFMVYIKVIRNF